jgi:hypothetical protein
MCETQNQRLSPSSLSRTRSKHSLETSTVEEEAPRFQLNRAPPGATRCVAMAFSLLYIQVIGVVVERGAAR